MQEVKCINVKNLIGQPIFKYSTETLQFMQFSVFFN